MPMPHNEPGTAPWPTPAREACVVEASRGIGLALVRRLADDPRYHRITAICRQPQRAEALQALAAGAGPRLALAAADISDAASLELALAPLIQRHRRVHLLINTAGVLQALPDLRPERRLEAVRAEALIHSFKVNAVGPLLLARAALPLLVHDQPACYASLSARVGSISDNRLGGWYAYRGAKAAQNQFLRTLAVEMKRRAPNLCVLALHPGTVDTELSRPFRGPDRAAPRLSPQQAAQRLLAVIHDHGPEHSGSFYAGDGKAVPW